MQSSSPSNDTSVDSIRRYEQYAKVDPKNVSLQLQLGDLYHQAGRFDDALAAFARCLEIEPGNVQARSRTASVMISQHRFADAESVLSELVAAGDTDPALQHNLGLAIYFQHRFDEARKHFASAAEAGLAAPSNFAYLARSLHHLGEMDAAIAAGASWANAAPSIESKSYLALLHMDGGDMQVGNRLGLEVLQQDASNVDANVVVGSASMEHQQADRARACFDIALKRDPENGRAWLGMGLVHLYDQQTPEAIAALANAARIFPDNAGIAVTYGWSHIIAKDAVNAEQAFEKALEVDRTFSESHAGLAAALALQGKLDRAQESLLLARRLDRHSIGADVAESFLRAAQGQQQEASDIFAHMLKKSPQKGVLPLIDQLRIYTNKKGPLRKQKAASTRRLDS